MRSVRRAIPMVVLGALALIAAACTPDPGSGTSTPKPNPVAVITTVGNVTSGNAPLVIDFDGTDSSDPGNLDLTYEWDFGAGAQPDDPGATTAPTATVTFPAGTYSVKLTVTNTSGRSGSATMLIKSIGDNDGDGFFPPADCNDNDATIYPGAPDPAGDGIDQNCDGVDGTLDAVFVSGNSGTDQATCGPISDPCKTIGQGINRAPAMGADQVYVNGGTYPRFDVVNGIDVIGGYGANWQRGLQATGSSVAKVTASVDQAIGAPVGITANGINTDTVIADLTVQAVASSTGQNSYGIHVTNSTSALTFDSVKVIGATAGNGANGADGNGGWTGNANSGSNGADGFEPSAWDTCNDTAYAAGGVGATGANAGGNGGNGGKIDKKCTLGVCLGAACDAQPGESGKKGSGDNGGLGGVGGEGATDGLTWICTLGAGALVDGANGANGGNGSPGAAGAGGAPGAAGANGGIGTAGSGGGGGGGGGANDCNADDAGAGGGGGGAGGAAAAVGGQGGRAGADSIAIRLVNSSPTFSSIQITLGTGGNGGNGGVGAAGQPGGAGGAGGPAFERGGAGGAGGAGGTGGASGVGGGGGGGAAVGIDVTGSSTLNGTVSYAGGQGGAGGAGGNNGSAGLVVNVR